MKVKSMSVVKKLNTPQPEKQTEPLILECPAGIILRVGDATLHLLPNGEIQLNGKTLKLSADQHMVLDAGQIRVNCAE